MEGHTKRYDNPLARVRLSPGEYGMFFVKDMEETTNKNTAPGDYIFLAPDIPLYFSHGKAFGPTRWDVVGPGFLQGEADQSRVIALPGNPIVNPVVIGEPDAMSPGEAPVSESYPLLYDYPMRRYTFNLLEG